MPEGTVTVDARAQLAHKMVEQIVRELHQTETSAAKHCPREAQRLGDAPAAIVLHAIADHAAQARGELQAIARARRLPESRSAVALGALFSIARITLFDRWVPLHLAYRGTLLGLRHGLDLMTLLASTLPVAGFDEEVPWCIRWLVIRIPLVEEATRQVAWLGANPEHAIHRPTLSDSIFGCVRSAAERSPARPPSAMETRASA